MPFRELARWYHALNSSASRSSNLSKSKAHAKAASGATAASELQGLVVTALALGSKLVHKQIKVLSIQSIRWISTENLHSAVLWILHHFRQPNLVCNLSEHQGLKSLKPEPLGLRAQTELATKRILSSLLSCSSVGVSIKLTLQI